MKTASINFRVDEQLKKNTKEKLSHMHLDLTTFLTMALHYFDKTGKIPFEMSTEQKREEALSIMLNEFEIAENEIKNEETYSVADLRDRLGLN